MLGLQRIRLFRTLENACRAGLPAGRALRTFASREGSAALEALAAEIEGGTAPSEAMRRRPEEFPPWQIEITAVGESTGRLDSSFAAIADGLERTRAFWLGVLPKLAYPVLLLHFVPFAMNSGTLISHGSGAYLRHSLAGLVPLYLALALVYAAARSVAGSPSLLRNLPFSRGFLAAAFARYLAMLVKAGVTLARSVELAAAASGVGTDGEGIKKALELSSTGASAAEVLAVSGIFTPEELDFATVSEEAGKLDEGLAHTASSIEGKNRAFLAAVLAVLPALAMLAVAGFVAWKIVSFYQGAFATRLGEGVLF